MALKLPLVDGDIVRVPCYPEKRGLVTKFNGDDRKATIVDFDDQNHHWCGVYRGDGKNQFGDSHWAVIDTIEAAPRPNEIDWDKPLVGIQDGKTIPVKEVRWDNSIKK